MKKNLTIVLLFLTTCLLAQSPQSFKYQALLRDKNGILIMDKNVSVRIGILQGSVAGTSVYSETHAVKTSASGTINLEIGKGSLPIGTFTSINWGKSSFFVKIEMDPLGGSAFELVGTSQLLSVPYALYAEKSGDEKWSQSGADIYYNAGQVSIGTASQASRSSLYIDTPLPTSDNNKSNGLFINATDVSSRGIPLWIRSNTSNLTYSMSPGGTLGRFLRFHDLRFSQNGMWDFGIDQNNSLYIMGGSNGDITEKFTVKSNGNIGIGIISPASKLDVNGSINATQYLLNGSPVNFSSSQIWNTSSGSISYSAGKVGIGTTSPIANLDVAGLNSSIGLHKTQFKSTESEGKGRIEIKSDPSDQGNVYSTSLNRIGDSSEDLIFGLQQPINNYTSWNIFESWRGAGLMVSASGPDLAPLTFGIDRVEKVRLDTNGNLGIGTPNPKAKLQVENGDIYINSVTSGVIMKSPNGQCWKMTVNNAGVPVFTSTTCPQ